MPVKLLSDDTINKIAAGEVIERPANVVKELVENALDAEARSITIDIRRAGKALIRVADDGAGMDSADLVLSVERHATSKITSFTDVASVVSLGFRGEALPSIAAVSRLTIQSRSRSGSAAGGWELVVAAGKKEAPRAWGGAFGTIIEVRDLFFNTPAREKFLKSETTERNRITAMVEELALARPDCAFALISDGKEILSVPRDQTLTERIAAIAGDSLARELLSVEADHPSVTLTARVTPRTRPLPSKSFQYLFVNGRPVNYPRFLMRALYDAYRELLPVGTHPGAAVYLTVHPGEIDVNIHPTKREVRFSKEGELFQFFQDAVRRALVSQPDSGAFTQPPGAAHVPAATFNGYRNNTPSNTPVRAMREMTDALYTPLTHPDTTPFEPGATALGQIFGTYVLAVWNDTLLILDQHAAAERVRYERYRTQWLNHTIVVQPLLLPLTIELPFSRVALVADNAPILRQAGWEAEPFGKNTVRISALPAILGTDSAAEITFAAALDALEENSKLPPAQRLETIIRAACRASIKARDALSREEIVRLVTDLFACENPHTCPHGRPTCHRFSEADLQKLFRRTI